MTNIGFLFGNYGRFRENVMTFPIIAQSLTLIVVIIYIIIYYNNIIIVIVIIDGKWRR